MRVAAPPRARDPWRRELHRQTWPSLDATLLGVDAERRRAYIKLRARKPARYVIDTIDIDSGERLDRWRAGDDQATRLADYDGRFTPLAGGHDADLERLAGMVSGWSTRGRREGSAWPVADASPGGAHVVYMQAPSGGREGDWLFLHDVAGGREVRLGAQTVASYEAKFSPDGAYLAWRGCVGRRPCRYHLYLSTVADASKRRPPHRVDVISPRGPIWRPDGSAVLTLGETKSGERCVSETTPSPKRWGRPKTVTVACHPKLSEFVLAPDGGSLLFTWRDGQDAVLNWRRLADPSSTPIVAQLRQVSELTVSNGGKVLADHEEGLLALDLEAGRRRLFASDTGGFVFVPTVHWLAGDVAIMLEKSFVDQTVRLVRMDVGRFLDGG